MEAEGTPVVFNTCWAISSMLLRNCGASDDSVCAWRDNERTNKRKAQANLGLRKVRLTLRIRCLGKGISNALHYRKGVEGTTLSASGEFSFIVLRRVSRVSFSLAAPTPEPARQRRQPARLQEWERSPQVDCRMAGTNNRPAADGACYR